jgi:hypothetical protein
MYTYTYMSQNVASQMEALRVEFGPHNTDLPGLHPNQRHSEPPRRLLNDL